MIEGSMRERLIAYLIYSYLGAVGHHPRLREVIQGEAFIGLDMYARPGVFIILLPKKETKDTSE